MAKLFPILLILLFSFTAFAQDIPVVIGKGPVSAYTPTDAVLYDQTGFSGTNSTTSQNFETANDPFDNQSADDFVVPAGETWTIEDVDAPGAYYNGVGPAIGFNVYFYSDAAGVPGTLVEQRLLSAYTDPGGLGSVNITLSPTVVLPEGTYWVSVQCDMDFGVGGQWGWLEHEGVNAASHWQNPGGGFGTPCTAWGARVTVCGIGAAPYFDHAFALNGTIGGGGGGGLPEVIYYQFNETGGTQTPNLAVPGSGGAFGILEGDVTMGPGGQFGAALIGSGSNGTINNVNTGWVPDLGTSDWTISMYLANLPAGTALNYLFGETNTGTNWRCFYSGAAGEFGVLVRTGTLGGTDVTVPGVGPGPSVLTLVYDSSGPTVFSYLNGVLVLTTPQAGALTMTGSGADFFRVGGHNGSTSGGLPVGSIMDEFRFYNRALDAAEVAATWNIQIPVELTSFVASVDGNSVTLDWETATEVNNSGFAIERKSATSDFTQIGFVAGFGTTTEPQAYSFTDNSLATGVYSYRLKQIDFDGTFEYSDVVEVDILAPDVYTLAQNYPNPFNPSTSITFSLATDSKVSLRIFDVLGQEVSTLVNQELTAGVHNYEFNATGINSGVYLYRIEATGINGNEFVDVKKMMLLK
jgi:hypothetical protein